MQVQSFTSRPQVAVSRPQSQQGFQPGSQADLVDIRGRSQEMGPDPITPLFYATVGGLAGGVTGATVGAIWAAKHGVLAGIGGGVGGAVVGGFVGVALGGLALKLKH